MDGGDGGDGGAGGSSGGSGDAGGSSYVVAAPGTMKTIDASRTKAGASMIANG